jgi:hypothetical protein
LVISPNKVVDDLKLLLDIVCCCWPKLATYTSKYRCPWRGLGLQSRVPEVRLKTSVLVKLRLRFLVRGSLKSLKSYEHFTKAPSSAPNLKPEPNLRNPASIPGAEKTTGVPCKVNQVV